MAANDPLQSYKNAQILHEYHLCHYSAPAVLDLLSESNRRFQWIPEGKAFDSEAKPGMTPFMNPIIDGGFSPDKCENNELRAVSSRVTNLKKVAEVPPTLFVSNCMDEFLKEIAATLDHKLIPCEVETVYEKQNRPSQRTILDLGQHREASRDAKEMNKNEAYGNPTNPRPITMLDGSNKRVYAQFIYPLAEHLKKFQWYAFGKTPVEIAARMVELCEQCVYTLGETDFSHMDGNVDSRPRTFERRMMMLLFNSDFHGDLDDILRKQHHLKVRTPHGVKYNTGFARGSGSMETSSFNTVLAAFCAYLGYRMTVVNGAYLTHDEAYAMLGMYAGDDGASPDADKKAHERAALLMGQTLECITRKVGEMGVSFLARRYGPDVWYGDNNSCCDIRRQVTKFHLTTNLPSNISRVIKLREKSFAFELTDRNTPLIGDLVRKVSELWGTLSTFNNSIGMWNVVSDGSQYPNFEACWMVDLLNTDIPEFDYNGFLDWLDDVDQHTIFQAPSFMERPPPIVTKKGTVVVDGDIHENEPQRKPSVASDASTAPASSSPSNPSLGRDGRKKHRPRARKDRPNDGKDVPSVSPKTRRGKHTPRRSQKSNVVPPAPDSPRVRVELTPFRRTGGRGRTVLN